MSARKILILTNRIPYPLKDGGNMAMNAMIEGYSQAGWQVALLSMNTSRHRINQEQLQKLFTHLALFKWVEVDNELKMGAILKNFFFEREPEHVKRFNNKEFRATLQQVLKDFKPDVVQVESVYLSSYLADIKEHSTATTVLRMHNVEYQIWQGLAKKTKNILKVHYFDTLAERVRNYERAAWKEYDLLLAITEKDAQIVHRLEENAIITVAPFGIQSNKIRYNNEREQWVGYHLGAMDWLPNHEGVRWFLNKAWSKVHKAAPSFEFYFAGRNMPQDFMSKKLPGVHCVNEVADAEEFIADKKILIVPLWSGGGIRVKILEAMAAGKIVITTSKGIKGIEAKPDEHYLRANSPEDFAKAVKWCINNKEEAEIMAGKARDLIIDKYEQGKVITTVITELEMLLKNK